MDLKKVLENSLKLMNIKAARGQIKKLLSYLDLLYEYNKEINLVGTRNKDEILVKHILDSLSILKHQNQIFEGIRDKNILDIGTGAGLPGIALSIFLKDSNIYLLEKTRKKVDFMLEVTSSLPLENIRVLNGRAEELSRLPEYREKFSLVLARAVIKFNILLEFAIPFCTINGKIIFYKSKKVFNEIEDHQEAISILGGKVEDLLRVEVPNLEGFRTFLIMGKAAKTPLTFPRNFAQIKKKPL